VVEVGRPELRSVHLHLTFTSMIFRPFIRSHCQVICPSRPQALCIIHLQGHVNKLSGCLEFRSIRPCGRQTHDDDRETPSTCTSPYSLAPPPLRSKSPTRPSHCPSSRRSVPAFSVPVTFLASFSHSNMTGMSPSPSPSTLFSNESTITTGSSTAIIQCIFPSAAGSYIYHSQCVLDPSPNSQRLYMANRQRHPHTHTPSCLRLGPPTIATYPTFS
jgi:hypothetical protein